jgi:hypothetical protein
VVQRVFRDGPPEQQRSLLKDELARYAKKLDSYKPGWRRHVEIFGISFPAELRTFADDLHPEPNGFIGTVSIEQGKALLAKLDETAKKGEDALKALLSGHGKRS